MKIKRERELLGPERIWDMLSDREKVIYSIGHIYGAGFLHESYSMGVIDSLAPSEFFKKEE